MKKIILFLIVIFVAGWALQNYSSVRVFDYAKNYWQKINWSALKNFKLPSLNAPVATPIPGKQLNIFIRDVGFVPNDSGLEAGGQVTWYNEDGRSHIIVGDNWVSPEIKPGQAYSKIFDIAGTYKYHDTVYPDLTGQFVIQ